MTGGVHSVYPGQMRSSTDSRTSTSSDAAVRAIREADVDRTAAQAAAREAQRRWEAALVAAVEAGMAPSAVAREAGVTRNRVSQLVSAHRVAEEQTVVERDTVARDTADRDATPARQRPRIVPSPLS